MPMDSEFLPFHAASTSVTSAMHRDVLPEVGRGGGGGRGLTVSAELVRFYWGGLCGVSEKFCLEEL